MMPRLLVAACFVAVLCTTSGCSLYAAPKMTVAQAAVSDRTAEGAVIDFTISAENTNDENLPLRRVTYSLTLDGKRVFEGVRSPEATLRRRGTQTIRLPAAVPSSDLPAGTVNYRLSGTLYYSAPGQLAEVLFDTGVSQPTAPFAVEGTIDLGE